MLQRLVRSIVSTAPRPYLIDDVPWLCRRVGDRVEVAAREQALRCRSRNAGLIASVSVNVPCIGQVFSIDDLAVALDDVRLDLADVLVDERLDRLLAGEDAGARFADAGRAERVGRPRPAELRSSALLLFRSGAGAHFGWNVRPSNCLLIA